MSESAPPADRPVDPGASARTGVVAGVAPRGRGRAHFGLLAVVGLLLLCACFAFRFYELDSLPGINADEAFGGLNVLRMLEGKGYTFITPSGQFLNPLYVGTQAILYKLFGNTLTVLRLPSAIWTCVGLLVTAAWHARVFRSWSEGFVLAAFTGWLPFHLLYSRIDWDSTYLFFWSPVVLYAALRVARGEARRAHVAMLAVAVPVSYWTHPTAGLFVVAVAGAVVFVRRDDLAGWLRRYLPGSLARLVPNGNALAGWLAVLAVVGATYVLVAYADRSPRIRALSPVRAYETLSNPRLTVLNLRLIGDLLSGYRAFRYMTGTPAALPVALAIWPLHLTVIIGSVVLMRRRDPADRMLGLANLAYFGFGLAATGVLELHNLSHERYVVSIAVIAPVVIVRALAGPIVAARRHRVALTGIALLTALIPIQVMRSFVIPGFTSQYGSSIHPTFWGGEEDPKFLAAQFVLGHLPAGDPGGRRPTVFAERWWAELPLQLILFGQPVEIVGTIEALPNARPGDFIVTFPGTRLTQHTPRNLARLGLVGIPHMIYNSSGIGQIIVVEIAKAP